MRTASIIIAAYNEEKRIGRCLDSLLALDYEAGAVEIIVVDNGSNDTTVEIARSYPVTLVSEPRKGAAHARNTGIDQAHHEIIVFVDADAAVAPDWMLHLTSPFDDPQIGAVGGKILPINDTLISAYFGHAILGRYQAYENERYEKSYATCNLAIRREWLLQEKFDPDFMIAEDVDLTMRLVQQGCKLLYEPKAAVYHEHPKTIREFFDYWRKWAKGRNALCKKYPQSRTCLLMRFQLVTLYYFMLVLCLILFGKLGLLLGVPLVAFVYKLALQEYQTHKRFAFIFLFVPLMNLVSVLIASLLFGYYRFR